MSGPGPHEISPLPLRLSPGEGSRTRANRARRLRSVSRRGDGCDPGPVRSSTIRQIRLLERYKNLELADPCNTWANPTP